jgi:hypothetical protein
MECGIETVAVVPWTILNLSWVPGGTLPGGITSFLFRFDPIRIATSVAYGFTDWAKASRNLQASQKLLGPT